MSIVLITGGSSGIGLALAKHFAADGHSVVLCAQDEQRLKDAVAALARPESHQYIVQDLATAGAAKQVTDVLAERDIAIDVLVNCAGFGTTGAFIQTDIEREAKEIQLNVGTLTELTKLLLPRMVKAGSGRVLNVASIAAFMPGPYMAVYYATKAYVRSFSQALHEELRGTGVTVSTLCPGPTASGFAAAAGSDGRGVFKGHLPTADDVAAVAYRQFMQGKRLIIPGWNYKVFRFVLRFLPDGLIAKFVARVQQ